MKSELSPGHRTSYVRNAWNVTAWAYEVLPDHPIGVRRPLTHVLILSKEASAEFTAVSARQLDGALYSLGQSGSPSSRRNVVPVTQLA
jgi:hypothetical protein